MSKEWFGVECDPKFERAWKTNLPTLDEEHSLELKFVRVEEFVR